MVAASVAFAGIGSRRRGYSGVAGGRSSSRRTGNERRGVQKRQCQQAARQSPSNRFIHRPSDIGLESIPNACR